MKILMLFLILIPALSGALLPVFRMKRKGNLIYTGAALFVSLVLAFVLLFASEAELVLFSMTDKLRVSLHLDLLSKVFMGLAASGFPLAGFFAFRYMEHEEKEGSFKETTFYSFYLLTLAALFGMDLSGNLIAMYFFFEMLTLLSMPLVLFERTKESIAAALKYLFYSVGGAFLGLAALFVLAVYAPSLDFVPGGYLGGAGAEASEAHRTLLLVMSLLGIIGFSAKAGMYPLHGWLPTAHPEAPAPASAVLSGIIAKAGVLAIIRLLYYVIGPDFLRGTFVQITLLSLSLLTVFMGSMMAFREKNLKKRLAYSSVSQISYALFGLFLLNPAGFSGGILQVLAHAAAKICLFLTAGSFIYHGNKRMVSDLRGIGKVMPLTLIAFTLASLSLVGIPPFSGFVSKWFLAQGALESGISVLSWLGPVILLISALLTAAYLFPITVAGFFPGKDYQEEARNREGGKLMLVPLLVLAVGTLLLGVFSGFFSGLFEQGFAALF